MHDAFSGNDATGYDAFSDEAPVFESVSDANDASDMLPMWARGHLSNPVLGRAGSREAIMERVRSMPVPRRASSRLSPSMRSTRWARRGLLTPFGATAVVGMLGLLFCVRSFSALGARSSIPVTTSVAVLGDTVVPALGSSLEGALHGTLRDTLRIVAFALHGGNVRSASVIGDFNAWRLDSTQLHRQPDGSWYARVVIPRDVVRYDFVVNDEPMRGGLPVTPASAESTRARLDTI